MIDFAAVRNCLKAFDFQTLFREHLGWDKHNGKLEIPIDGITYSFTAIAQKRGFAAYTCSVIPDRSTRLKIDHQITKSAREHFVIYVDQSAGEQVWQWVRREPGKPIASRDHRFNKSQSGEPLIQRLNIIAIGMQDEEQLTLFDVTGKAKSAFDVDKITKKFYDRFKAEHAAFLKFIKGIKGQADLEWYTSLMLNRLMFVYFIQKKGFLDGDEGYLQNRMRMVHGVKGKDKFHSFYRYFLLRLFHEGLGKHENERILDKELEKLLGKVPYLNGGFFEVHQLEERNPEIDIPDKAFERLFAFFDEFKWHLDERPLRDDREINPDVVGYIFEKYINQKQMGAYYTKEDITEYISKNTIIPFLFNAAEKKCPIAFKPDSYLWRMLRDNPDRYIYSAVRHGVIDESGEEIPLPKSIAAGVKNVDKRGDWNKEADEPFALPTETWREHVARRTRCLELRRKLTVGEVNNINDLITLNLDIWQFTRDAIVNCEGPELLRAFWQAIQNITVLDPTCGSGAFLFAALQILESLYSDCLERMQRFVEDLDRGISIPDDSEATMLVREKTPTRSTASAAKKFHDFRKILADMAGHASERYFILKSIIINNLFGVDIMEEAVEICKLRLFLKLVAQVERVDQIEPLPDIDFNIRAGNTLVGYVSLKQIRDSQEGMLGFAADDIARIEEDALAVDKAFQQFRAQQTKHGGRVTYEDKLELRKRLLKLDSELDRYLAEEYGINGEKFKDKKGKFDRVAFNNAFEDWRTSHEPLHWFVEFYGIIARGGFDVIIGNPPWVEYAKVNSLYTVKGFSSASCNNLWAYVMERSLDLLSSSGWSGLIVPMSLVCTERMLPIQKLLREGGANWLSSFESDSNPGQLFIGVKQNVSISIHTPAGPSQVFTTRLFRFFSEARNLVFYQVDYIQEFQEYVSFGFPKMSTVQERRVLDKMFKHEHLRERMIDHHREPILVHRIAHYYIKCLTFVPYFCSDRDGLKKSEDYKEYRFEHSQKPFVSIINSSLFYFYWQVFFDAFKAGKACVEGFPCKMLGEREVHALSEVCDKLMSDIKKNSKRLKATYSATGKVEYDQFYPRFSKPIMDEADQALASHYDLTKDELDFIINYDIKFRSGADDTE